MAQPNAGAQPEALKPALDSMTVLVAAVIVHDRATNRVVLLQRGENAKFGRGMWDLSVGKSEPGEPITVTAVRAAWGWRPESPASSPSVTARPPTARHSPSRQAPGPRS